MTSARSSDRVCRARRCSRKSSSSSWSACVGHISLPESTAPCRMALFDACHEGSAGTAGG
eukprot:6202217-Pleurochrysis_carterae.AAC.1